MLVRSGGEYEDVIHRGDAEGKIAKDSVYHPLKGGTRVVKAKTRVIEGVGAEGESGNLTETPILKDIFIFVANDHCFEKC